MMKIFVTIFLTMAFTAFALIAAAGYGLGDYLVDFSLRRGNAENTKAPPAAYTMFMDTNVILPAKPDARESEEWSIVSDDGLRLSATYFRPFAKSSHRWVILVHGYGRSREDTWDYAAEYLRRGYAALTPDLRACGRSEGAYITMGAKESEDIGRWVESIVAVDPDARIVLHGISMGAATVMLAAGKEMPNNLCAVIEDCGYTGARQMFAWKLHALFGLDSFPLLPLMDCMSRQKAGVSLDDMEPLKAVGNSRLPMLFIHGDADKLVPYAMMQELYHASASSDKEELTVKDAAHAAAKAKNPGLYYQRVFSFADRHTDVPVEALP